MIFSTRVMTGGVDFSFAMASGLRRSSRDNLQGGEGCGIGGCTGAKGRGEISVRGTTGGGGLELGGWPSASKNLRMRCSSDSTGAREISGRVRGADVDPRISFSGFSPAWRVLLATRVSN